MTRALHANVRHPLDLPVLKSINDNVRTLANGVDLVKSGSSIKEYRDLEGVVSFQSSLSLSIFTPHPIIPSTYDAILHFRSLRCFRSIGLWHSHSQRSHRAFFNASH